MAQQADPGKNGMKTWLKLLLVGSLALNLLVAGAVGSAIVMHGQWHGGHPPRPDMIAGPLTRALSQKDRRELGRKIHRAYRENGSGRSSLREEFEGLITALEAEPFAPEAVAQIMARQRDIFRERLAFGQDLLLEHLTAMSPEERAAYAERLRQGVHRHWHNENHSHKE